MVEALRRHKRKFRKKTKNDFEKEFFKLMNNSLYRECKESQRH